MYDFKKTEPEILNLWQKNQTYEKAKEKNIGKKKFYFLDGPPYTSGKLHLGHAWNYSMKDMILRYKRMTNHDAWDRPGYDTHGLPTAHAVQDKLNLKGKEDIQKFGVAKFIEECKKLCQNNLKAMKKDQLRLGVWMDFDNPYITFKNEFIEGEWWLIKEAEKNKRLYEGEKVMHWCAHCSTALAKHELEYHNDKDDSIYLKFQVKGKNKEFLIIWTTTPWTIPFNLGVMANPEIDYVKAKVDDEIWILAKALTAFIPATANKKFKIIEEFKGDKLEGTAYIHPLKELKHVYEKLKNKHPKVHTVVLSEEYVDTSAGSGLVHMAPGCGPEDYEIGHKNNIPPFNNLDETGKFPEEMGEFKNLVAKKDDDKFIKALKDSLIATAEVEHEYAHCWRCKSPVIFRTTKQWFFKIEDLKENMRELNKKIFWQPDWAGSRQFDSWLDNLRDNSITRQRFWGTPVPIWRCECGKYEVIGSIKELKEKTGKIPKDLHKPYIDELTIKCSCGKEMKRIPDILDVWVDAGTTSWTCLDYPQNKELFRKLFPADFILEGKDQIRGWFNLLFVVSMVSMNKPSYKAVYMHGFINDAKGRKMSKSLGNYILPNEVVDKYGADTLRYFMIGGAEPGVDLVYNFDDVKTKHRNLIILWNLYNFLIDYSKTINKNPIKIKPEKYSIEEKYILSKLNSTIEKTTNLFEKYKLNEIPWEIENLFLDLSRTYIQLVREKSAIGTQKEKEKILNTIYTVLLETLKLFAPTAPFITEKIYQGLKQEFKLKEESIHMFEWPKANKTLINKEIEENFQIASSIIQSTLSAREKAQLGLRWPLKELIIVTADEKTRKAVTDLQNIIKTQTNIKEIDLQEGFDVKVKVKADFAKIGPEYGELAPKIIAKLATESAQTILKHVEKGAYKFKIDNKDVKIIKNHLIIEKEVPIGYEFAEFRHGDIYIYKNLTEELEAEGYAREIMRRIQAKRKKSGLNKRDEITLFIKVDEELKEMLKPWEKQIKEKVGAKQITISTQVVKKHKFSSKEKVRNKQFELYFDKI